MLAISSVGIRAQTADADAQESASTVFSHPADRGWWLSGLMPKVANGITFDWDVARSRGQNLEVELPPTPALALRLLGHANHASMGSYDEAICDFLAGPDARPDVTAHRAMQRIDRPGYSRDRGPVVVGMLRLHLEL